MNFILKPWQLLFAVFAGWVHEEQQKIIEFYQAEIRALMDAISPTHNSANGQIRSGPYAVDDTASIVAPRIRDEATASSAYSSRRRADLQHFLNFLPLPHGHGSLRPTRGSVFSIVGFGS